MSENQSPSSFLQRLLFSSPLGTRNWPDVGLLILRIYAGVTMAGGGLDKIPVGSWFAGQVEGIGFPLPRLFAFLAAFAEFGGGWLLVLGLCVRPAAFLMAFTMGVASWTIHAEVAFWGLHIARIYFWVYVALTLTGGGRYSLDHWYRAGRVPGPLIAIPLVILASIGAYYELLVKPNAPQQASASFDEIETLSLPGTFNNWTLDATPMARGEDGVWRASVEFEQSGPIEFKFAADNNWALNAGAAEGAKSGFPLRAAGQTNLDGEPANVEAYIPKAGTYEFKFEVENATYSVSELEQGTSNPTKEATAPPEEK